MEIAKIIFDYALQELQKKGFANAKALALLMVAQSKHESGNYTSHVFLTARNAFGYSYYPGSIYQVKAGVIADNKQPVASYANVADSALEMADWLARRKFHFDKVNTTLEYVTALKTCGYFGDTISNYLAGVNRNFKSDITA